MKFLLLLILEPPIVQLDTDILDGVVVKSGVSVRLKATVTGRPYPRIAWSHDGKELTPNAQVCFSIAFTHSFNDIQKVFCILFPFLILSLFNYFL